MNPETESQIPEIPEAAPTTTPTMEVGPSRAAEPGADHAALESELREALRGVVDPEINLDIVTLGLVREIFFEADRTDVQMILTTPFCPYAGILVQQTKDMTRQVIGGEVGVTLLDEPRWTPDMMEGGDWAEWGLV
jgi:metal-sulfur cluster biosynthetic enzyme